MNNVDEKTPQMSPQSSNSNYFSNNRSQIVMKSFSKKSPSVSKQWRPTATNSKNGKLLSKKNAAIATAASARHVRANPKSKVEQQFAQSKAGNAGAGNRTIQLPTSSTFQIKRPMNNDKTEVKSRSPSSHHPKSLASGRSPQGK